MSRIENLVLKLMKRNKAIRRLWPAISQNDIEAPKAQEQGQAQACYAHYLLLEPVVHLKTWEESEFPQLQLMRVSYWICGAYVVIEMIAESQKANRVSPSPSPWFVCEVWRLLQTTQYPVHGTRIPTNNYGYVLGIYFRTPRFQDLTSMWVLRATS